MVEKNLERENGIENSVHDTDDLIHTTGIIVDNVAYDTGVFLDRDYDVRMLRSFMMLIENKDGANGLDYTIQEATKTFNNPDDLDDTDFVNVTAHTDVTLAAGVKGVVYVIDKDVRPDVTAVRLRAKETIDGNASLLRADIRGLVR